ncbi:MAG: ABC transporter ATP-binding protein [Egibacteraceae bacterium]
MRIDLAGVRVEIDGTGILDRVGLSAQSGEFVALVGPNGCGKSTLLRTIYRALRPSTGTVRVGDADVWRLSARESARRTAVVAQEAHAEFDFTVSEVVLMGRTPHKGPLEGDSGEDLELADRSLRRVGMTEFGERIFATLSGGEKQRVLIARALAQQSPVVLLDEPTNHLDIRYQIEIMALVRNLGVTALAAVHDLNLAAEFCDRIYVMRHGRIVADGPPADVLTPELIRTVFGVQAHPMVHPATGRLHLAFTAPDAEPARAINERP